MAKKRKSMLEISFSKAELAEEVLELRSELADARKENADLFTTLWQQSDEYAHYYIQYAKLYGSMLERITCPLVALQDAKAAAQDTEAKPEQQQEVSDREDNLVHTDPISGGTLFTGPQAMGPNIDLVSGNNIDLGSS